MSDTKSIEVFAMKLTWSWLIEINLYFVKEDTVVVWQSSTCLPICYKSIQHIRHVLLIYNVVSFSQVAETEGASLAASHGIGFCEVSVAENTPSLYKAFERLLTDSRGRPVKQRKFSVCKMIGESTRNVIFTHISPWLFFHQFIAFVETE